MTEATVALAVATFLAVIVALMGIHRAESNRRRDKRDGFIAQIADWAVEVWILHHPHGDIEPSLIPDMMEKIDEVKNATLAGVATRSIRDQMERCTIAVARGGYLGSLAETFDRELSEAVNDTLQALEKVITDFRPILADLSTGGKPVQTGPDFEPVIIAAGRVLQRAKNLIAQ